jgi:hypothetical protein
MKYFKFRKTLLSLVIAGIALSGCEKVIVPEDTGSKGQKIIGWGDYGSLEAANFGKASLSFDLSATTVSFQTPLKYSGPSVFDKEVTAAIAVDAAALTAYNAAVPPGGLKYLALPANAYTITTPTVKFVAGSTLSTPVNIDFHPNVLDPALSYMLPLSIGTITGAPEDVKKAPGSGTAYFHIIGSPLAGTYTNVGTRYNYTGTIGYTGGPIPGGYVSTAACGSPKVLAAVSPTVTTTYYANLGAGTGRDYYFTYDPAVSLTNIDVTFTPSFLAGISNLRIPVHTYDPATKKIHIISTYNNQLAGAGDDRVVEETLTKQ